MSRALHAAPSSLELCPTMSPTYGPPKLRALFPHVCKSTDWPLSALRPGNALQAVAGGPQGSSHWGLFSHGSQSHAACCSMAENLLVSGRAVNLFWDSIVARSRSHPFIIAGLLEAEGWPQAWLQSVVPFKLPWPSFCSINK